MYPTSKHLLIVRTQWMSRSITLFAKLIHSFTLIRSVPEEIYVLINNMHMKIYANILKIMVLSNLYKLVALFIVL